MRKFGIMATAAVWLVLVVPAAHAGKAGPPQPLNAGVKYEPYPDTDIARLSFKSSRQEFRVGHAPYKSERFHLAEYVLVTGHLLKYQRPDLLAEIKVTPKHTQPEVAANPAFQKRWRTQLDAYRKTREEFSRLRHPRECAEIQRLYLQVLDDEIMLAETMAKRLFRAQQIRDRELVCQDLRPRLAEGATEKFSSLCDAFSQDGNLLDFLSGLRDNFIEVRLEKARGQLEELMKKQGVELAASAEE
jgi:hypothetical protein